MTTNDTDPPVPDSLSAPLGSDQQSAPSDDLMHPDVSVRRNPLIGIVFGSVVGMLIGVPVGAAVCWLLALHEFRWQGALIGAVLGPLGGALIGWRGRQTGTNIATIICAVYGLLPGLLLLGAAGIVKGSFSVYALVGLISIGPMVGLMIGAMFDRAYDEGHKNAWSKALGFGITGMAVCLGLAYFIAMLVPGLDPEKLAPQVKSSILKDWRKNPGLRGATIQKIALATEDGKLYKGFVEATIHDRAERFRLEVVVTGDFFNYTLEPLNE